MSHSVILLTEQTERGRERERGGRVGGGTGESETKRASEREIKRE